MISRDVVVHKFQSAKDTAASIALEVQVYRRILQDPRTPRLSRVLLGCAALYTVAPFDLVPDILPIVGQVDDAFVISSFMMVGLSLLPEGMLHEHRQQVKLEREAKTWERRERYNRRPAS